MGLKKHGFLFFPFVSGCWADQIVDGSAFCMSCRHTARMMKQAEVSPSTFCYLGSNKNGFLEVETCPAVGDISACGWDFFP